MSCLGFSADGKCVHKALVVVEFSLTPSRCKFFRIINKDFELAHRRAFEVLAREKSAVEIRGKWKLGQSFWEKLYEFSQSVGSWKVFFTILYLKKFSHVKGWKIILCNNILLFPASQHFIFSIK